MTTIEEFPNYLIYEDGRVFNKKTKKQIATNVSESGYVYITLHKNNTKKNIKLHKLLLKTFRPDEFDTGIIDHIDRNRLNNNLDNLRYTSQFHNLHNISLYSNNSSGYTGVYKHGDRYISTITVFYKNYKKVCNTLEEALDFRNNVKKQYGLEICQN